MATITIETVENGCTMTVSEGFTIQKKVYEFPKSLPKCMSDILFRLTGKIGQEIIISGQNEKNPA